MTGYLFCSGLCPVIVIPVRYTLLCIARDLFIFGHQTWKINKALFFPLEYRCLPITPASYHRYTCSPYQPLCHTPSSGYWDRLHTRISKFIWKGKQPRIKFSTLQHEKSMGGLEYFYSFILRPISVWLAPDTLVSWRPLEEDIISPNKLQDLIYANAPLRQCRLRFDPIVSHWIAKWRLVERLTNSQTKWHSHSPIFHNYKLLTGNYPFSFSHWSNNSLHHFADIFNDNGLCKFHDLQLQYNLPGSSFFFYLRLRSAMHAYGVPWGAQLPMHPHHNFLIKRAKQKGCLQPFTSLF